MPSTKPIIYFGEIMLRLSPPNRELLLQSAKLDVWVAGAEANVATSLAQLDHSTRMVTALPDNPLGEAAVKALRAQGVYTGLIQRREGRMGLYFVTPGAGLRATEVIYDRAFSAFAEAPPESWGWDRVLEGAGRLHLSGITPALGPNGTRVALAAAEAATSRDIPISFDGNWRGKLWDAWDGKPQETLSRLVAQADILFGNYRDVGLLLDQHYSGEGEHRRREAAEAAFKAFPKLRLMASTARHVEDSDHHRISARIDTPERGFQTEEILLSGIVDRIGAGDSFAAGILHGLLEDMALEDVAQAGLALTALKHSLPGDASLFNRRDLAAFLEGGLDVRR
ncbi:MAG TPA: sugar kinase [Sphingomonas sp.]|uniref:sugar kinase n=1 Tax=Sphingomonas sp. TaxID=28214 RepID=UPI002CDD57A6|nr:sugar kinase [Sphingomonas sp.]HMI20107.1 sugar kinase [Sphingomonas sp.]